MALISIKINTPAVTGSSVLIDDTVSRASWASALRRLPSVSRHTNIRADKADNKWKAYNDILELIAGHCPRPIARFSSWFDRAWADYPWEMCAQLHRLNVVSAQGVCPAGHQLCAGYKRPGGPRLSMKSGTRPLEKLFTIRGFRCGCKRRPPASLGVFLTQNLN